jgi:AcrR family transcriptional regulator
MAVGRPTVKGEARQLILDTAEDLFASHGVEGVSLRTINAAAGVSPGVLHYHFGSREVLVHELISRHMQGLMTEREQLLQPLLAQSRPRVEDIVRTLVDPLARLAIAEDEAGPRYVRFIARLYSDRSPMLEEVSQRYLHVQRHYPELLQRALPDTDAASLSLKLAMANHAMLQLLSDLTSPGRPWLGSALQQVDNAGLTAMLVDFMSAGISGRAGRNDSDE